MGQITIYLEKQVEEKMRMQAQVENRSLSQWIASLIKERVDNKWPDHIAELSGQWEDFPNLEELRTEQGEDADREVL